MEIPKLIWTEQLMIAIFLIGVVAWGFRMRKSASSSMAGMFLAGRKVPGFIGALSTVATNMNVNDFIGGAGFAYATGVVLAHSGMVNALALMLVSVLVMGKLRRLNMFSLGGWLEKRYCMTVGVSYSVIWSVIWMVFNLGLYIYGGAFVLNTLLGWNIHVSIIGLSVVAAFYTLLGGFGAVVATDVLQLTLMFFPFVFLTIAVWMDIGSLPELVAKMDVEKAVFWKSDTPFGPMPLFLFGTFFMGLSYWSCEAQVVQRPLSARSEEDASISYLATCFWYIILNPFVIMLPALAALVYFPGLENPDHAMPLMVRKFLPSGLYGVTVVGLIAGFFSSADSQINAFCSMFTTDLYQRFMAPGRDEKHYLRASKVMGVIFTMAAIATAYLVRTNNHGMMLFAIGVLATIMPPFAAITILGAVSKTANGKGATAGLAFGGFVAVVLAVLSAKDFLVKIAEQDLYFRTLVTFIVTVLVTYGVSWATGGAEQESFSEGIDFKVNITPKIRNLLWIMTVAIIAMYVFFTWFF